MTAGRLAAVLLALVVLALGTSDARAQSGAPSVGAPSAILVEPATGDVVVQKNANRPRAIASTTKLMTALLTLEELSLDDTLAQVPYAAAPAESLCGLRTGERLTVRDYLRCLLVVSGNEAAATLAVRVAGSRPAFVRRMNQRARQLGLTNTTYADPIGLSPQNRSTATDLVKLTLVLRTKPFFREVADEARVTLQSGSRPRTLLNRNLLVRQYPYVNGVKTGRTTSAGYVLVGSATRRGITVVSAVLGAATEQGRVSDSIALLRYGLRRYRVTRAVVRGRRFATATLRYRDQTVDLVASRTVRRTARRGEELTTRVIGAPAELEGPLPQGARVGTIEVRQRGEVVARVPLVTAEPVAAATAGEKLQDFASRRATVLLLATFVACSLLLVLLRRRAMRGRRGRRETELA